MVAVVIVSSYLAMTETITASIIASSIIAMVIICYSSTDAFLAVADFASSSADSVFSAFLVRMFGFCCNVVLLAYRYPDYNVIFLQFCHLGVFVRVVSII